MLERVRFEVMPLDLTTPKPLLGAEREALRYGAGAPASHAGAFEAAYAAAWLPVFRFALAWTMPSAAPTNVIVECSYAFSAPQHVVATDDGGATWRELKP